MSGEKISIIMPAYNAGSFIGEAVRSVLAQDHRDWELIIVNDGSTDGTAEVLAAFSDPRIIIVHQENRGIGGARNRGLQLISGQFLATLDADDVLPPRSLSSRLDVLRRDPGVSFADGRVQVMDRTLERVVREYRPSFRGEPLSELVRLTGSCFFGPTWLIRLTPDMELGFDEHQTHAEDLRFYISLAPGRRYDFTGETVLFYRRTGESAMSDLDGLMRGYDRLHRWLRLHPGSVSPADVAVFARRVRRIAIRSYAKSGQWGKALSYLLGLRRPRMEGEPDRR